MLRRKAGLSANSDSHTHERRRSLRLERQVPLAVRWVAQDGSLREEATKTHVINAYGCLLLLQTSVYEGMDVELVNIATQAIRKGKVVWCGEVSANGRNKVGIELEEPDLQFWEPKCEDAAPLKVDVDWWG